MPNLVPKRRAAHLEEQERRMEFLRHCKAAEAGATDKEETDNAVDEQADVEKGDEEGSEHGEEQGEEEGSQGVWAILDDDKADEEEDKDGFKDFLKIVPTKFLLQELATRCTR
jgi:hypothetical protein